MTELDTKSPANSMYPVPTREMDNQPDMGAPVRGWLLYYCISRTILGPLGVESQQVVLFDACSADRRRQTEASMRSVPVVLVQPGVKLLAAFV